MKQIWDLVTGEQLKNLNGHTDRVLTLQFDDYKIGAPNKSFIAQGSQESKFTPPSLLLCYSFWFL